MGSKSFSGFNKKTIIELLKQHPGSMMSARDIVEFLYKENPDYFDNMKKGRHKKFIHINDFLLQLTAELHSKMGDTYAYKVGYRKYYSYVDGRSISPLGQSKSNKTSKEKRKYSQDENALYPIVCKYLWGSHRVFSMRIDERKSPRTKNGVKDSNLYPDIVGMEEDLSISKKWNDDVVAMSNMTLGKSIGIWSVEVKNKVDRKSVRECLSQTHSNSSWANRAYLAAAKFSNTTDGMPDEHVDTELHEYAELHGIGVIKIDKDDYRMSEVLIEARESDINWKGANKLAKKSEDFAKFLKNCRRYHELSKEDMEWQDLIIFLSDFLISNED